MLFFGANVQEAQIPGRSQVVALPPGSWTLPWMAPSLCRRLSASAGALTLTLFALVSLLETTQLGAPQNAANVYVRFARMRVVRFPGYCDHVL